MILIIGIGALVCGSVGIVLIGLALSDVVDDLLFVLATRQHRVRSADGRDSKDDKGAP